MNAFRFKKNLPAAMLSGLLLTALVGCGEDDEDEVVATSTYTVNGSAGAASLALTSTSPSYSQLTIYGFAVSANQDCSNPTVVFSDASGIPVDMNAGPEIGSGSLANGTYECVIIEMSDSITFRPADSLTTCNKDTEYQLNVCPSGFTSTLIDGTSVTCTDGADERVAVYLSTMSTVSNPGADSTCEADFTACNAFTAPTSSTTGNGLTLQNALTVSAAGSGTFNMDATNKVSDVGDQNGNPMCDMGPPIWSFQ